MKPAELHVYDRLPELGQHLNQLAVMVCGLPLEDMAAAADRVALTGTYTRDGESTPIAPAETRWMRAQIDAAVRFRDTLAPLAPANHDQSGGTV